MHRYSRFALSYAPDPETDLAVLGKHWLGWDLERGQEVPLLKIDRLPLPLSKITARRRRYGCQAILVPPFCLASGHSPLDLHHRARAIAEHCTEVTLSGLRLDPHSGAMALLPRIHSPALERLCVTVTRSFRDLQIPAARGDKTELPALPTPPPFQFQLSDPLPRAELVALSAAMRPIIEPNLPQPFHLRSLSLVGEDATGWFHLIQRYPLRASGSVLMSDAPIRAERPRMPLHW
ncbi:MAG: DUF1045 domain-containing protein [Pseudomonadota bacterium]